MKFPCSGLKLQQSYVCAVVLMSSFTISCRQDNFDPVGTYYLDLKSVPSDKFGSPIFPNFGINLKANHEFVTLLAKGRGTWSFKGREIRLKNQLGYSTFAALAYWPYDSSNAKPAPDVTLEILDNNKIALRMPVVSGKKATRLEFSRAQPAKR